MTEQPQPGALEELVRAVERLRAERDDDRALLEELQTAIAALMARKRRPPTVYPDWQMWVSDWLAPRISRHPHRARWCHQYAEHPEVADRLEALWHAWEALWPEPATRVTWYRDGLDHQLAVITAEDGPLRECSAHEHQHLAAANLAELGADHDPRRNRVRPA